MTSDEAQPRLFDPDRYSPATVAVFQRLPESSARAFAIASALGSVLDQNGTTKPLTSVRQATGTLISPRRLPAVLAALGGLNPRQWRRYVTDWEHEYVAHRCSPGIVFLFARPLLAECPACKSPVSFDHIPKSPIHNHGLGFGGRSTSAREDVQRPFGGASTSAGAAHQRPRLSTTTAPQENGLARDEVGVGLKESEASVLPGVSEIAARACERCGHEHFTDGGCRRVACDCKEAIIT